MKEIEFLLPEKWRGKEDYILKTTEKLEKYVKTLSKVYHMDCYRVLFINSDDRYLVAKFYFSHHSKVFDRIFDRVIHSFYQEHCLVIE